ncbi:MAG: hypothetical protein ACRBBV_10045 [Paracoccaceae bacterium]
MRRKKVFIVGAGASKEFDLPTGMELVKRIEQAASGSDRGFEGYTPSDTVVAGALGYIASDLNQFSKNDIFDGLLAIKNNMGLAPSIDNFLEAHSDKLPWALAGKVAIARCILQAEARSPLKFDNSNIHNRPEFFRLGSNWLSRVFQTLVAQRKQEDFFNALKTCHFITFNYDRIIEQFFHQAIKSYFQLSSSEVDERCRDALNVLHVYGHLGDVNCQTAGDFGGRSDDSQYLARAAQGIRTFSEGVSDPRRMQIAKAWIDNSDVVAFLGFGFLPLNLEALAPSSGEMYKVNEVIGTSLGLSTPNRNIVEDILKGQWFGWEYKNLNLLPKKGFELIEDYSYFLSEFDLKTK